MQCWKKNEERIEVYCRYTKGVLQFLTKQYAKYIKFIKKGASYLNWPPLPLTDAKASHEKFAYNAKLS